MSKNACEQQAARPEWLQQQISGKNEADQKLWSNAYDKVHGQNHFQKDEGPSQALERLKKQGLLQDMSISDIPKEAQKIKVEQGKDGVPKNVFSTRDAVLSTPREHQEITRFVEAMKKSEQASRLAPSCESLSAALTPERAAQMKAAGLETDPKALHDKMVKRMTEDRGLTAAGMEKMKTFPVGAAYVASGAITGAQMDSVMREQKAMRDTKREDAAFKELRACNPEEYKKQWQQYMRDTEVGTLLRVHAKEDPRHWKAAKIAAADSLVTALKDQEKQKI